MRALHLNLLIGVWGGVNGIRGPYFPSYHPRPGIGHMNDPNGPFFFAGVYHLFFQHSCSGSANTTTVCAKIGWPGGKTDGFIGWAHLTSTNLADWYEQPVAFAPPFADLRSNVTQYQAGFYDASEYTVEGYFTGSATIVNGQPRMLIPTVVQGKQVTKMFPDCEGAGAGGEWSNTSRCLFDLQVAIPKNISDPLLRDWVVSYTPFPHNMTAPNGMPHNFVFEDPDQAIRDPTDPQRWLVIHDTSGPPGSGLVTPELLSITGDDWASADVRATARSLGSFSAVPGWGGCCPAWIQADKIGADVLYNCGNDYVVGDFNYTSHSFVPRPKSMATRAVFDGVVINGQNLPTAGASKGFYDDHTGRYLHWSWIWEQYYTVSGQWSDSEWGWDSCGTVTREVTLDFETEQLIFYPVDELASLRGPTSFQRSSVPIPMMTASDTLPPSTLDGAKGAVVDIEITVRWPGADMMPRGQLVVSVLVAEDGSEHTDVVIDSDTGHDNWGEWMPETDLPCMPNASAPCDLNCTFWDFGAGGAHECASECEKTGECQGWTFVNHTGDHTLPRKNLCCLKRRIDRKASCSYCTSGLKHGVIPPHSPPTSQLLVNRTAMREVSDSIPRLKPQSSTTLMAKIPAHDDDEATMELRILLDVSVFEVYAQRGRAHITGRMYPGSPDSSTGIRIGWRPAYAIGEGVASMPVADITVWPMRQGLHPIVDL